jgi:hypothetical protein
MTPSKTELWKLTNLGDGIYNIKGGRANKYCAVNTDRENRRLLCESSDATQAMKFKLNKSLFAGQQELKFVDRDGGGIVKFTPYVPSSDPFV